MITNYNGIIGLYSQISMEKSEIMHNLQNYAQIF